MTRKSAVRQALEGVARGNYQPRDIQEARIIYNIQRIYALEAPSFHGKMRAVDVQELQMYAASIQKSAPRKDEGFVSYGANLALRFAASLGLA